MYTASGSQHKNKFSLQAQNDWVPAQKIAACLIHDFFNTHAGFHLPIERVNVDQQPLMPMQGKVVLVTGGSRGIGRATCERFAAQGCTVIGTSRAPEKNSLKASDWLLLKLDVRSDESVKTCIDEIVKRFDHIDILVNNAGIGQYGRLIKSKPQDWLDVFETNLIGVHRVTQAVYPHMHGPARIITLGSLEGETGYPYQALYAMSKRALQTWNDAFDFEQRNSDGVRCTLLEPAWVNTGFGISPDIVNTEPHSEDPYARIAQELFPQFLKRYGVEPAVVADAIVTIAAMQRPRLRYYVGAKGALLLGHSLEDLLTIAYTQPPERMLAFMDAIAELTYRMGYDAR